MAGVRVRGKIEIQPNLDGSVVAKASTKNATGGMLG